MKQMLIRNINNNQLSIILKRWLDIVIYAVLAAELWIILFYHSPSSLENIFTQGWAALLLIILAVFVSLRWVANARVRFSGLIGYNHIHTYPPLWMTLPFGGVWILIRMASSTEIARLFLDKERIQEYRFEIHPDVVIPIILVLILAATFRFLQKSGLRDPTFSEGSQYLDAKAESYIAQLQDSLGDEFRRVLLWLKTDAPVRRKSSDRFEHTYIAGRIARRLRGDSEQRPTLGVVGPFGSGKTSIANMLKEELETEDRTCLVQISAWPYENVEALIRGIAHELVSELSIHVNTLAVTGLSERYLASIAEVGGVWAPLARLLRLDESPGAVLQRFANILVVTNLYFVLWIDDLSRFSEGKSNKSRDKDSYDHSLLEPVRSFLHLLDQCPNLSVIVADTTLETRTDIGKIARFIEYIPKLTPNTVWPIIRIFRDACFDGYPHQIIDPNSPDHRDKISQAYSRLYDRLFGGSIIDTMSIAQGIPILLDTPRVLKNALRLTHDIWFQLAGDIDFDDVLIASILRVVQPDIFAFISDNRKEFIQGFEEKDQNIKFDREKYPVLARLDQYQAQVEKEHDSDYFKAIETLISFLLPNYPNESIVSSGLHISAPQKLAIQRHTDNWANYMNVPDFSDEDSDQRAIEAIRAWQKGDKSDLVDRLRDYRRAGQIETFVGIFKQSEICRLLREIVMSYLTESTAEWDKHSRAPALTSVFRMTNDWTPEKNLLRQTLYDLLEVTVPVHLPLTQHLFQYFGEPGRDGPWFFPEEEYDNIRARLDKIVAETYQSGAEQQFIDALMEGSPYNISWLVLGIDRQRRGIAGELPFDGWSGFADLLLNVAQMDPEKGFPILLPIICNWESGWDRPRRNGRDDPRDINIIKAEFLSNEAERLFDYPRLLQMLADAPDIQHSDEGIKKALSTARQAALELLDEMKQREEEEEERDEEEGEE